MLMLESVKNMEGSNVPQISCQDIRHFKETLKSLRQLDDKIIYKLNTSVPTESFKHEVNAESKCKTLYTELLASYTFREDGINKCIAQKTERIKELQNELGKQGDNADSALKRELRNTQSTLKAIQSELMVEDVVKVRSLKVFNERCWKSYIPSQS